jgi:CDP-diacylglycerol---serine O-phosphatidyltransferase
MKNIPNLFTLLNLFFGCMAIVSILQTGESLIAQSEEGTWVAQFPEQLWYGSLFIGIAGIIDFFDGFVARLMNASSSLGKQLDSLADVVSFGVAPSLIFYQLLRIAYIQEETALETSIWLLSPAFIFACAAAWRLGRFNIDETQSHYFRGVPAPAAGLLVASLPLILFNNYFGLTPVLINKWVIYALVFLLSWLMVSTMPLISLKIKPSEIGKNIPLLILAGVSIAAIFALQWLAVPLIFVAYIVVSLIFRQSFVKSAPVR